jgi:hypothetical protein
MEYGLRDARRAQNFQLWDNATDSALLPMESELLATSIATRSFTLTSRDLDIIYSTGIYKYLSVFQLQRLHFPNARYYRTATHRIGALITAGLLTRVFYHPKLSATTGRPASILYLTSANLDTLATYLSRMGRASLFTRFEDIAPTDRKEFAYTYIMHELGISELYMGCVRDACNFSRWRRCPAEFTLLDGEIIF